MTARYAAVLALPVVMAFGSFWLLTSSPRAAAIVVTLAFGIALALAVTTALNPVAVRQDALVRDRRIIEDMAHGVMLQAARVCLHTAGAAAVGCDCHEGRPW